MNIVLRSITQPPLAPKTVLSYFLKNNLLTSLYAYTESYNTQHVLIKPLGEWRQNLDKN